MTAQLTFVRASSLPDLFDCPARWFAKNILKLRMPSSSVAALGTAIHASTGAYDGSKLAGNPLTVSEAEGAAVDAIYKPEQDVDWDEDLDQRKAEGIARALHRRYCKEIAPTQEYVAVEATCEALEISDLGIVLTGTVDRVRKVDERLGISDLKSGKQAVGTDGKPRVSGHVYQLAVYELLAEASLNQRMEAPAAIVGLQTGVTEKAQRVGMAEVSDARSVLIGEEGQPGLLEMAARMIEAGAFPGNPRSMLCGAKFCPVFNNCKYRK